MSWSSAFGLVYLYRFTLLCTTSVIWISGRVSFWFRFRGKLIAGRKIYRVGSRAPVLINETVYSPDGTVFGRVVSFTYDSPPPQNVGVADEAWTRFLGVWKTNLDVEV